MDAESGVDASDEQHKLPGDREVGGDIRLIAFITDPAPIRTILPQPGE